MPAKKSRAIDVTSETTYHLLLENPSVRVFRVEIAPKDESRLHWHDYDFIVVTLEDSRVSEMMLVTDRAQAVRHDLREAKLAFADLQKNKGEVSGTEAGLAHSLRNKTDKAYRNTTIELKKGQASIADSAPMQLRAGEPVNREWRSTDHLLVMLTDGEFKDEVAGADTKTYKLKAGEVAWIPAGTSHTFSAAAGEIAFYTIGFKTK